MTTISGIVDNTGVINVDPSDDTLTVAAGGATLEGGGQIDMSDSAGNIIEGINDADLTNVNNTIVGAGSIQSLTLVNDKKGVIDAIYSDNPLYIETGEPTTNQGMFEATAGGVLYLSGETVNNASGTIRALGAGSVVDLYETTIEGGAVKGSSGGAVDILAGQGNDVFNGTVSALTISGAVNIIKSGLTIEGAIDNTGTISLKAGNGSAVLAVGASGATLTGGGHIKLDDHSNNQIVGANDADLTNVDDTIVGAGMIESIEGLGLSLVNESGGVIDAIYSNDDLVISTAALATNDGLMEATQGGVLYFSGQSVANADGTIKATGAGSTVDLFETDIQGGLLTAQNGGAFDVLVGQSNDVFDGTANAVEVQGSVDLNELALTIEGTIDLKGTISLVAPHGAAILYVGGSGATLQGGGVVSLSDSANNYIQATNNPTLTNVDDKIMGAGNFDSVEGTGLTVVNDAGGSILATYLTDDLIFATRETVENNGVIGAMGGYLLSDDNISGSGVAEIGGGGTANFRGYFNENTVFDGAGTLQIDGNYYSGAVSHMGVGDTVDETNVKFPTGQYAGFTWTENAEQTGGVLDVNYFNGSLQTSYALNVEGLYIQDDFAVGSDQANDTIIDCVRDDTVGWKTAVSGAWTSAARWTSGSAPASGADVVINVAGTYTVTDTQSATLVTNLYMEDSGATLHIGANDTFTLDGYASISGTIQTSAGSALDLSADVVLGVVGGSGGVLDIGGKNALLDIVGSLQGGTLNIMSGASALATGGSSEISSEQINLVGALQANADLTLFNDTVDAAGSSLIANGATLSLEGTGIGGGTLTAMNGGAFSDSDGGTLNGVTLASGASLTIENGGEIEGVTTNKGDLDVQGSNLIVTGSLVGTGMVNLQQAGLVDIDGAVGSGQTFLFSNDANGNGLSLGDLSGFSGVLSGFTTYEEIDLVGLDSNASLIKL